MYTAPVIAGTNRRPICCVPALRRRTVTVIDHTLLISLEINNCMMSVYIYILMTEGDWTNENEE